MTLFCLFSLSIVKIAGLRSFVMSNVWSAPGPWVTFSRNVSSHSALGLDRIVSVALGDSGLFSFSYSSEKHFCLFVYWTGNVIRLKVQIPCLGWQPKFHFNSVTLNSEACCWHVRREGSGPRALQSFGVSSIPRSPHFAFLLSFFPYFWAERIWHLAQAGFSCLIWHRLVTAYRLEAATPKLFMETGAAKTWARTILLPPAGSTPGPVDWPDSRLSRRLRTVSSRLCKMGTDVNLCLSGSEERTAEGGVWTV